MSLVEYHGLGFPLLNQWTVKTVVPCVDPAHRTRKSFWPVVRKRALSFLWSYQVVNKNLKSVSKEVLCLSQNVCVKCSSKHIDFLNTISEFSIRQKSPSIISVTSPMTYFLHRTLNNPSNPTSTTINIG